MRRISAQATLAALMAAAVSCRPASNSPDAGMTTADAGPTAFDAGVDAGPMLAGDGGWTCPFPQADGGSLVADGGAVRVMLADGGVVDGGDGSTATCALPDYCFSGNPAAGCVDPGRCVPDEGRYHLAADVLDYPYISQPPSSGPHNPVWATWGVSDVPIERVHYVHNEEHGGIVLVYNCPGDGGCPEVVQAFTDLYNGTPSDVFGEVKVIVTADADYDGGTFAAAAWDHVYAPPAGAPVDLAAMRCFISTYIDRGPEMAP